MQIGLSPRSAANWVVVDSLHRNAEETFDSALRIRDLHAALLAHQAQLLARSTPGGRTSCRRGEASAS